MEPCAPGTEDEPHVPIFPVKKNNETERLLSIKTLLPNGSVGHVFELTNHPTNGSESWYCHVCGCPVMGPVFQHEVGRRHNMKLSKNQQPQPSTPTLKLAPGEPVPPGFEGEIEKIAQIQENLDNFQMGPLIGLEYLIEIQEYDHENKEPSYLCMLCDKRGDPRTVMAHLVSYNHRLSYLQKHFPTTWRALVPYSTRQYKRGWQLTIHKISEAIEGKYGRLKPISVEREQFERKRTFYNESIAKTAHFDERMGTTFESLVDGEAIKKAAESTEQEELEIKRAQEKTQNDTSKRHYRKSGVEPGCVDNPKESKRSPSPPVVAKPIKKSKVGGSGRRSLSPVSSISSSSLSSLRTRSRSKSPRRRGSSRSYSKRSRSRSPYYRSRRRRTRSPSPYRSRDFRRDYRRGGSRERDRGDRERDRGGDNRGRGGGGGGGGGGRDNRLPWQRSDYQRPRSSEYDSDHRRGGSKPKVDKMEEFKKQCGTIEADMDRVLKQHEKNPEKHPQYNDEWKKFWNRRYKELQAEGKDHSQHDFKPEWIEFWNKRMVEMHQAEVKAKKDAVRKRLNLPDEPAPISFKIMGKKKSANSSSSGGGGGNANNNNSSAGGRDRDRERDRDRSSVLVSKSAVDDLNTDAVSDTSLEAPAAPEPEVIVIDEDKDEDSRSLSTKRSHSPWETENPRSRSRAESHSSKAVPEWRKDSPPLGGHTVLVRERDFDPYKPPRIMREATRKPVLSPPRMRDMSRSPQTVDEDGEVNVIGVLRLLTALEEHLGSLGPKVIDLLSQALGLEKAQPNAAETLLDNEVNCVLIETVKEKLKGLSDDRMGMVSYSAKKRFKVAITKIASLLHFAAERKRERDRERPKTDPIKVPGIGTVDKSAIAKQIANALILQGKTDVTTGELEQLIDAVVGMAQASQGANKPMTTANFVQQMSSKPTETIITPTIHKTVKAVEEPTVSALQMLQGAYTAEMAANNMDGLSDSDLQTLLQNFKDLSTEEQHGLITYLKKLEAKEPQRVERLRKFVNLGGGDASSTAEKASAASANSGRKSPFSNRHGGTNPTAHDRTNFNESDSFEEDFHRKTTSKTSADVKPVTPTKQPEPKPVKIDSDDEEYTFEDVFKAASNNLEKKEKEEKQKQIIEEALTQRPSTTQGSKLDTNLMDAKALIANIIGHFGDKTFNNNVTNLLGLSTCGTLGRASTTTTSSAHMQPQLGQMPRLPPQQQGLQSAYSNMPSNQLQQSMNQQQNLPLMTSTGAASAAGGGQQHNQQLNKPIQYPMLQGQQQPQQQQQQYPNQQVGNFGGPGQQQSYGNVRAPISYPQQQQQGYNRGNFYQQPPPLQNNHQQPYGGYPDYSGSQSQQQGGYNMAHRNSTSLRPPLNPMPNNQYNQQQTGIPPGVGNPQQQNFQQQQQQQQFGGNRNFY